MIDHADQVFITGVHTEEEARTAQVRQKLDFPVEDKFTQTEGIVKFIDPEEQFTENRINIQLRIFKFYYIVRGEVN